VDREQAIATLILHGLEPIVAETGGRIYVHHVEDAVAYKIEYGEKGGAWIDPVIITSRAYRSCSWDWFIDEELEWLATSRMVLEG
jgi:hypothetical protein